MLAKQAAALDAWARKQQGQQAAQEAGAVLEWAQLEMHPMNVSGFCVLFMEHTRRASWRDVERHLSCARVLNGICDLQGHHHFAFGFQSQGGHVATSEARKNGQAIAA